MTPHILASLPPALSRHPDIQANAHNLSTDMQTHSDTHTHTGPPTHVPNTEWQSLACCPSTVLYKSLLMWTVDRMAQQVKIHKSLCERLIDWLTDWLTYLFVYSAIRLIHIYKFQLHLFSSVYLFGLVKKSILNFLQWSISFHSQKVVVIQSRSEINQRK